jgi:hypothetical protein
MHPGILIYNMLSSLVINHVVLRSSYDTPCGGLVFYVKHRSEGYNNWARQRQVDAGKLCNFNKTGIQSLLIYSLRVFSDKKNSRSTIIIRAKLSAIRPHIEK